MSQGQSSWPQKDVADPLSRQRLMLTLLEDFAKVLVLAGTVPASKAELVLAFAHAQLGTLGHFVDNLRLGLAQFGLLAR